MLDQAEQREHSGPGILSHTFSVAVLVQQPLTCSLACACAFIAMGPRTVILFLLLKLSLGVNDSIDDVDVVSFMQTLLYRRTEGRVPRLSRGLFLRPCF